MTIWMYAEKRDAAKRAKGLVTPEFATPVTFSIARNQSFVSAGPMKQDSQQIILNALRAELVTVLWPLSNRRLASDCSLELAKFTST